MTPMRKRLVAALFSALPLAAADAAEPYPYVGVYSVLEAKSEAHFGMDKFLCLASINVQREDGSYTSYHVDMAKLGKDGTVRFHPYEEGTCTYTAATKTERCRVLRSNWGEYEYIIEHKGEIDGAHRYSNVSLKDPSKVYDMAMRKCPFPEQRIAPHLSGEWLDYSDDDIGWVIYRYLPFNPDLGDKAAANLGIKRPE